MGRQPDNEALRSCGSDWECFGFGQQSVHDTVRRGSESSIFHITISPSFDGPTHPPRVGLAMELAAD